MADKNKPGDYFNRPEKLGAWKGFKQFMWNPETSQFMGRTSGSWGKQTPHTICHLISHREKFFLANKIKCY